MEKADICHSENADAVRRDIFDRLTSLLVDHDKEQLRQQIEALTSKNPPDYSGVFGLLDITPLEGYGTEGVKSLAELRKQTVRKFWDQTQKDVAQAVKQVDIVRVDDLYGSFILIAGKPNEFQEEAVVLTR